jgi:hypothetical protein
MTDQENAPAPSFSSGTGNKRIDYLDKPIPPQDKIARAPLTAFISFPR